MNLKPPAGQEHLPEMMGTRVHLPFLPSVERGQPVRSEQRHHRTPDPGGPPDDQPLCANRKAQLDLKIVRDNFFFNSIRIPVKADRYSIFKIFSQEMGKRMIGEMEFAQEVEAASLKDFVFLLARLEEG